MYSTNSTHCSHQPSFLPIFLFSSVHYPLHTNTVSVIHHVFFFSNPQTSCIMKGISACALHVVHQTSSLMACVPRSSDISRGATPPWLRLAVYYFCPPLSSATLARSASWRHSLCCYGVCVQMDTVEHTLQAPRQEC